MNNLTKTTRHDAMVCNKCEPSAHQHQRSDMVVKHNGDVECAYCGDKKGSIASLPGQNQAVTSLLDWLGDNVNTGSDIHFDNEGLVKSEQALEALEAALSNPMPQVDWIYPVEGKPETWPEHGQHVIVWEDRFNVHAFPRGCKGDDGKGRYRMGDAIFNSGQFEWDQRVASGESAQWDNDPEKYRSMNRWNRWKGQGPCDFSKVICWQPMPSSPEGFKVNK